MASRWTLSGRGPRGAVGGPGQAGHDSCLPARRRPGEQWNDSLAGDYLWTNGNLGEALPDVMTPATWSFISCS